MSIWRITGKFGVAVVVVVVVHAAMGGVVEGINNISMQLMQRGGNGGEAWQGKVGRYVNG